jgi:hypothetical protein
MGIEKSHRRSVRTIRSFRAFGANRTTSPVSLRCRLGREMGIDAALTLLHPRLSLLLRVILGYNGCNDAGNCEAAGRGGSMKSSGYSTARIVVGVVLLGAVGGVIGHLAGVGVVQLWFRPGGGEPVREVAAAPYVFTIVGCLLGTLVGMGWAAYVSAMRAIRSGYADPSREPRWQGHQDEDPV